MSELKQAQAFFGYPEEHKCGIDKCEDCEDFKKDCIGFVPTFGSFREEESGDELKFDNGKPRCDLVPAEIIEAIGAVRTYGVQKYGKEFSYRDVEPKRYRAALMRHICTDGMDFGFLRKA